ncbi:MAG: hypothetical protein ABMA02_19610 [Saprospiraceae bacterium]
MPIIFLATRSWGQDTLIANNLTHRVEYSGAAQDFIVPMTGVHFIRLELRGGDGGQSCRFYEGSPTINEKTPGGDGAKVSGFFAVGYGPGEIRPGSMIRFVVGGTAGEMDHVGFEAAGYPNGGGGGTGVLAMTGGNALSVIAVAGGGGGAYQSQFFATFHYPAQGGRASENGGNGLGGGAVGGINGTGGEGTNGGAGGGGANFMGGNIKRNGIDEDGGGGKGYPSGGSSDLVRENPDQIAATGAIGEGAFGFGAGGAGTTYNAFFETRYSSGGGGGYSGGGAGPNGGGGGGSFLAPSVFKPVKEDGGAAMPSTNGHAIYRCITNEAEACQIAAKTFTWVGGTGNWDDASKWSPAGIPGMCDVVNIAPAAKTTINLNGFRFVKKMTLGGAGIIGGTGSLTVKEGLTVNTTGGFEQEGAVNSLAFTTWQQGYIGAISPRTWAPGSGYHTYIVFRGTVSFEKNFLIRPNALLSLSPQTLADINIPNKCTITVQEGAELQATCNLNAAIGSHVVVNSGGALKAVKLNILAGGKITLDNGAILDHFVAGQKLPVNVSGTLVASNGFSSNAKYTLASGGKLEMNNSDASLPTDFTWLAGGTMTLPTGAALTMANDFSIPSQSSLNISGGTLNLAAILGNLGTINFSAGKIVLNNAAVSLPGGNFVWTGGTLQIPSGKTLTLPTQVNGAGRIIEIATNSTLNLPEMTFSGKIVNYGTVNVPAGIGFNISGNGSIDNRGLLKNSGTINVPINGSGFVNSGTYTGKGNFTGSFNCTASVIRPGDGGPAKILIGGANSFDGTLEIELGGTTPGTQFDQVNALANSFEEGINLNVEGMQVVVSLINGFRPTAGQTFTVLSGSFIIGTPAVPVFPAGVTGKVEISGGQLNVKITGVSI